jgi:hypothetical protein
VVDLHIFQTRGCLHADTTTTRPRDRQPGYLGAPLVERLLSDYRVVGLDQAPGVSRAELALISDTAPRDSQRGEVGNIKEGIFGAGFFRAEKIAQDARLSELVKSH